MTANSLFDGPAGRFTARVMARQNRDAEMEAIEVLAPRPTDAVVAIGVGAGVGVDLLARRVAFVLAVDPSRVMVDETRRRVRAAVDVGRVEVARTTAAALPLGDATADGAIAVNSIQMWEPLETSLAEVARVLRPGGRLVTLTHDWALERSTGRSVENWTTEVGRLARRAGFAAVRSWRATAERGRSVAVELVRADAS